RPTLASRFLRRRWACDPMEAIRIGVRLRPLVSSEAGPCCLRTVGDNVILVETDPGKAAKEFAFDYVMDSRDRSSANFVSQERCYQLMAEKMVEHALQGYSTCLFCYGQTGTGKTTTILGRNKPLSEQGLLLRLVTDLFKEVAVLSAQSEVQCRLQIVEVHNERVRDLLTEGCCSSPEVHVHPKLGVYLKHVADLPVPSLEACLQLIEEARGRQTMAPTAMNPNSSRGHGVYKLSLESHGRDDNSVMTSEVFFVDLAGRENERTTKVSGDRLVELGFINRSLMWLSQCIHALGERPSTARRRSRLNSLDVDLKGSEAGSRRSSCADKTLKKLNEPRPIEEDVRGKASDATMARFRNSKLTLLLAKALSGNSKTSVICTLSPARANADETITTLHFAASLKHVKVEARPALCVDKDSLISGLQAELSELRVKLSSDSSAELSSQLEVANGMLEKYRESWQQKIEENEQLREQRNSALRRLTEAKFRVGRLRHAAPSSVDTVRSSSSERKSQAERPECPHLAGYSDDPGAGRLFFPLTEVGYEYCLGYAPECHFTLARNVGIAPRSAFVWVDATSRIFLRTEAQAAVEVNHLRLEPGEPKELFHGDFLVLGSSICFFVSSMVSGNADLRVQKLPTWWSLGPTERAQLVRQVLGSCAPGAHQVALHYMSTLQGQNLDSRSFQRLDKFLLAAKRTAFLVAEANALTDALKPLSNLKLELSSLAPVMVYGYGDNFGVPDLCVRLIRMAVEAEVVAIWSLAQFEVRLQTMRQLHEKRLHSPDRFALDTRLDPWGELVMPTTPSRRLRDSRPDICAEVSNAGAETSSLAQDAERLLLKMDNLLAQQTGNQQAGDGKLKGARQAVSACSRGDSPGIRGRQAKEMSPSDQLADASTSFSSAGLTSDFTNSPGEAEAEYSTFSAVDWQEASPSFARFARSGQKARSLERARRDWRPKGFANHAEAQWPGIHSVPVPGCLGWSSVPVSGEIFELPTGFQASSVQSTPGYPVDRVNAKEVDIEMPSPRNPFEHPGLPTHCRWTLPARHAAPDRTAGLAVFPPERDQVKSRWHTIIGSVQMG
ncbi:unnamed protein product, partial [Effrenium voratum]